MPRADARSDSIALRVSSQATESAACMAPPPAITGAMSGPVMICSPIIAGRKSPTCTNAMTLASTICLCVGLSGNALRMAAKIFSRQGPGA